MMGKFLPDCLGWVCVEGGGGWGGGLMKERNIIRYLKNQINNNQTDGYVFGWGDFDN